MQSGIRVRSWRPRQLIVDRIGPFRESVERVSFSHCTGGTANLYMLAAGNGRGKTTILEALYFAMRMLDPDFPSKDDLEHDIANERDGRLQFDLLVELEIAQVSRTILLSLSWGDVGTSGLGGWTSSPLEDGHADRWLRYGWAVARDGRAPKVVRAELTLPDDRSMHGWDSIEEARAWLEKLLDEIAAGRDILWPGFNSAASALPSLLYFTASRDIVGYARQEHALGRPTSPRFKPAHRFDRDGQSWFASLDNLLIWYYWLSREDFESARGFINTFVFGKDESKYIKHEPDRDPPRILVMSQGSEHPLGRLSSGEKNLVQFALRLGAHRTQNAIILVDEVELHLHPELQRRVVELLKNLVSMNRGAYVIFTTHSLEVMKEFRFEVQEEGLSKGGEILLG